MQLDSTVLGQTPFGDVHVGHHFQARDNGRLQQAQLRRYRHFVQDSVDPIPNTQVIFEWLDVNVGRPLDDGLANDLIHELDYRSFRIIGVEIGTGFSVL